MLFRPLPYRAPERLVAVSQTNPSWLESPNPTLRAFANNFPVSYPVYEDWLELSPVFDQVGVWDDATYTFSGGDRPERIEGARATHGVLAAFGVQPVLGRLFLPEDDQVGAAPLVLLSHGLWQSRFGADPAVVGRPIRMDEQIFTVVGVMPREFYFPDREIRYWATFDDETRRQGRGTQGLRGLALLGSGHGIDDAQLEMERVNERIAAAYPGEHDFGVRLTSYKEGVVGDVRPAMLLFLGGVGMILLIACANIANLLLVRAGERRHELAVRAALGAGRSRLLGQMMSESLVLSLAGGATGVMIALFGLGPLTALFPPEIPRAQEIVIDTRVLLFAVALSLLTGLLTGLVPAFVASRTRISSALSETTRGAAGSRRSSRAEESLVVAEVAIAFLLLVSAGLVLKSFANLTSVERGFESERRLTVRLGLPESRYPDERVQTFYDELEQRLSALPGVESVAAAAQVPVLGGSSTGTTLIENRSGTQETNVHRSMITAGYFETLGIPIQAGRAITRADREGAERVAMISESMARQYWPDEDPVGRRLKFGDADSERPWLTVVGVASDVRQQRPHIEPRPWVYIPAYQTSAARTRTMILKTSLPPGVVAPSARQAVWAADPELPIGSVTSLDDLMARHVAAPRFRTLLLTLMAAVAIVLSVVGVYGVIAHGVSRRTREFCIRMALGARPSDVLNAVLRRGGRLVLIGLSLGLAAALAGLRVTEAFLFEVSPGDPLIVSVAALLLALAAFVATFLPARRASRVDPVSALRN